MNNLFRRMLRTGISLLLAVSMIAGSISIPVSAAKLADVIDAGEDGIINYVTFGASQTNGYGLRYYFEKEYYEDPMGYMREDANYYGYERTPEGAYPYQVAKTLRNLTGKQVEIDQLALSAMRAEELHMLLDDTYYGDAYTKELFYNENGEGWFTILEEGGLPALRERYQTAVVNSDLITVDIGVNNFGYYALGRLTSGAYDADLNTLFTEEELEIYEKLKAKVYEILMQNVELLEESHLEELEFMAETFAYAGVGFMVNFDAVMSHIYELNPDANVVVVSIQNMMKGIEATVEDFDVKLPLGEVFNLLITASNFYMSVLSPYAEMYCYASKGDDAHVETFFDEILAYDGDPKSLSQNIIDCFNRYDSNLFTDITVDAVLNNLGVNDKTVREEALNAAYDILATVMREAAEHNTLNINVMLDSMSGADETFMTYLNDTVVEAVAAVANGEEYDYVFDRTLLEDPAFATAMVMSIRFSLGGRFFAHPNEKGHLEVRNAILDALKAGTKDRMAEMIAYAQAHLEETTTFEYEVSEDSYYVSIGDGVTAGVGFSKSGYTNAKGGYMTAIAETFPYKVAEELGLTIGWNARKKQFTEETQYMQLGRNEFSAEVIRYILDETYEPDAYALDVVGRKLDTYRDDFENEIAKADLITVGFSNADITAFVVAQMKAAIGAGEPYEIDWEHYINEKYVPYIEETVEDLKLTVMESGIEATYVDVLTLAIESYGYAYLSYLANYTEVIELIREVNPNAEIIMIGMHNPMGDLILTLEDEEFALGDFLESMIDLTNAQALAYSLISSNVTYVEATEVETLQKSGSEDGSGKVDIISFMLDIIQRGCNDFYPSEMGHEYIKDQIVSAKVVPGEEGAEPDYEPDEEPDDDYEDYDASGLLGDVNGDGIVDTSDAQAIFNYFMGAASEEYVFIKENADINSDGAIDTSDAQAAFNIFMGVE